ncbi:hypothetical protein EW146_g8310 [Bondarzewia mesenterica]|uniref:C2H2-type domain-containing protein n=1 Tax=Bondarzewia mesenterica TaxID=1095465 RepID=A0A4V3XDQ7_9AGAM|nr:hypothetical protein EW146_g8310 [Bondarzewia mesenterica]
MTPRCQRGFVSLGGLRQHRSAAHPFLTHGQVHNSPPPAVPSPPPSPLQDDYQAFVEDAPDDGEPYAPAQPQSCKIHHPILDGTPVDEDGKDLPPNAPPPPYRDAADATTWTPFDNRTQFELADFLFRQDQMPATRIDTLLNLWASSQDEGEQPPFSSHTHVHSVIDSIGHGDVKWESFTVRYTGEVLEGDVPPWMLGNYNVWFRNPRDLIRNQLANPDFKGEIDYAALQAFDENSERVWTDFMTGNWAWRQSNKIGEDLRTHEAMFVPVILGSDKTTVSVATGQNEYYPLYISNGNIHSTVRRAHRNAVSLVGFLAILKKYSNDAGFHIFRRQLYHLSLATILKPLRHGMTSPEITRCSDGHLRRVIYGLGPYIADYPEQVMLACIVSGWCPRCRAIPDDLDGGGDLRSHDHTRQLMESFNAKTLWDTYGVIDNVLPFTANFPRADIHELISFDILHQIIKGTFKDHLVTIAAAPSFPGLRRFPEGRGFKQWTEDDSKALMKVFLPAIVGHVPPQMVCAISTFMDFCYLVRRSVLNETTLQFGAPNGLCSSITESKHIKAVKEPWRRSNHFNALGQMLLTNQRLDKLAAICEDFKACSMLNGPCLSTATEAVIVEPIIVPPLNEDAGAVDGPKVQATVVLA